jgi:hypothetical protein
MVVVLSVSPAFASEAYVRAIVGQDGGLQIHTADGRIIEPAKDADQVSFDKARVSPDGLAVGWVAEYPNCCTSYPIPRKLMIFTNGQVRTFAGNGLMISQWGFQAGGSRFAFKQETVHSELNVHYELRDVASGELFATYDPPVRPDNRPAPRVNEPSWVAELDALSKHGTPLESLRASRSFRRSAIMVRALSFPDAPDRNSHLLLACGLTVESLPTFAEVVIGGGA